MLFLKCAHEPMHKNDPGGNSDKRRLSDKAGFTYPVFKKKSKISALYKCNYGLCFCALLLFLKSVPGIQAVFQSFMPYDRFFLLHQRIQFGFASRIQTKASPMLNVFTPEVSSCV